MRSVRVALPLAIMLGLAGSTSAFLQNVRPTHVMVPAHKYQAAVSRARMPPRALRSMRVMSATVETDTEEVASLPAVEGGADEVAVPEIPAEDEASVVPELSAEVS